MAVGRATPAERPLLPGGDGATLNIEIIPLRRRVKATLRQALEGWLAIVYALFVSRSIAVPPSGLLALAATLLLGGALHVLGWAVGAAARPPLALSPDAATARPGAEVRALVGVMEADGTLVPLGALGPDGRWSAVQLGRYCRGDADGGEGVGGGVLGHPPRPDTGLPWKGRWTFHPWREGVSAVSAAVPHPAAVEALGYRYSDWGCLRGFATDWVSLPLPSFLGIEAQEGLLKPLGVVVRALGEAEPSYVPVVDVPPWSREWKQVLRFVLKDFNTREDEELRRLERRYRDSGFIEEGRFQGVYPPFSAAERGGGRVVLARLLRTAEPVGGVTYYYFEAERSYKPPPSRPRCVSSTRFSGWLEAGRSGVEGYLSTRLVLASCVSWLERPRSLLPMGAVVAGGEPVFVSLAFTSEGVSYMIVDPHH